MLPFKRPSRRPRKVRKSTAQYRDQLYVKYPIYYRCGVPTISRLPDQLPASVCTFASSMTQEHTLEEYWQTNRPMGPAGGEWGPWKVELVPIFTGGQEATYGNDAGRLWLDRLHQVAKRANWDDDTKLDVALIRMAGDAQVWADSLDFPTLTDFEEAFEHRFCRTPPNAFHLLNNCVQTQDEGVAQYTDRFRQLCRRLKVDVNLPLLVTQFIQGLKERSLCREVLRAKPTTLQEALEEAIYLEMLEQGQVARPRAVPTAAARGGNFYAEANRAGPAPTNLGAACTTAPWPGSCSEQYQTSGTTDPLAEITNRLAKLELLIIQGNRRTTDPRRRLWCSFCQQEGHPEQDCRVKTVRDRRTGQGTVKDSRVAPIAAAARIYTPEADLCGCVLGISRDKDGTTHTLRTGDKHHREQEVDEQQKRGVYLLSEILPSYATTGEQEAPIQEALQVQESQEKDLQEQGLWEQALQEQELQVPQQQVQESQEKDLQEQGLWEQALQEQELQVPQQQEQESQVQEFQEQEIQEERDLATYGGQFYTPPAVSLCTYYGDTLPITRKLLQGQQDRNDGCCSASMSITEEQGYLVEDVPSLSQQDAVPMQAMEQRLHNQEQQQQVHRMEPRSPPFWEEHLAGVQDTKLKTKEPTWAHHDQTRSTLFQARKPMPG